MALKIEASDTMKSIWGLMLKSKESAEPAASIWEGLCRVNRLASDYVKEHYGAAAIEHNGRFYTPDCLLGREPETAKEKRARIRAENKWDHLEPVAESPTQKEFDAFKTSYAKRSE